MGIIAPTMNYHPRNVQEGDLEFSTRYVSNPNKPDLFTCDTSTTWIVSPINKPYVYAGSRVGLDYFLNIPFNTLFHCISRLYFLN